jgi:hypothetical protein
VYVCVSMYGSARPESYITNNGTYVDVVVLACVTILSPFEVKFAKNRCVLFVVCVS